MKILSSFDTFLDYNILNSLIDKYGEGNVMLIKRHYFFLFNIFLYMFFLFLLLIILLYIITLLYNEIIFYLMLFLYSVGIIFWTGSMLYNLYMFFKNYKYYVIKKETYKKNNNSYSNFIIQTIFQLIFQIVILVGITLYFIFNLNDGFQNFLLFSIEFIINIAFIYIIYYIIKKIIDFEMDFFVITPHYLISYNQTGFFKRQTLEIDVDKIKTISVNKKGIIRSLLNFGEISIFTEGDNKDRGELILKYIHYPEKIRNEISKIIKKEL